ncbi:cytochrome b [Martelella mediterranea]|uniref:Cytochrome b561 n=1 Tax=Martelella mediterranea TaxID=293089 RepID=A0A4R3NWF4_9HYPH|nr:cytochrome b [Martelella mediterranea]TCT42889.1 cytochrome b561 [Martelella mediterranea]
MIKNTSYGYGALAILFHWAMALLIVGMLALGLYMSGLPQTDPQTFALFQLHKSIGFVVLLFAVLRLLWRAVNPSPKLPSHMPVWEKGIAHLGHTGLYAMMFLLPLSGWLMVSASPWGIPTIVFNLFEMPHLPVPGFLGDKASAEAILKLVHEYGAYFLIALIIGHVAAAMKHHFISRDETLRRMISVRMQRTD